MSGGLSITAVAATGGPTTSSSFASHTALTPVPPAPSSGQKSGALPFPDPKMAIDPSLGISVLEYLSSSGAIVSSIPSQQQLQSYQQGLTAKGNGSGKHTLTAA
jgi:hypothetical protein